MNRDDILAACQKSGIENLHVLTSGKIPPNPAELLAGKCFPALIEILSKEYDYILIDTPPVLVVTDALVLKPHVNGYVIVARAEESKLNAVKETIRRLNQVEAKVCGFLLNGKKEKTGAKYGKYGRYSKYAKYGYGE
jgi:capsular exopolysaccharide synthesis family protein